MKKFIIAITAVMLCVAESLAHDVEIDGIYYNSDEINKTAEVTYRGDDYYSYDEYSGSVTIPETITYNSEIYSVTSIGSDAFNGCYGLTSVTIPNSVTSIGSEAFRGCSGLTSVTIPNSVTSIGYYAFGGCSGLTELLVLSNNEEFSSENGVLYNKDKTTLIKYPEGKKDTSFTIPNSVTSIGKDAFSDCSGLTSVTIPISVTFIGYYAFSHCRGLTSVTIPNSVTSIDEGAFDGCRGLTSVTIGEGVTSIGSAAFRGCSGLTSVTIPNSVTSIGDDAFYKCSDLTEILVLSNNEEFSSENGVLYNKDKTTLIKYPDGKKDTSFTIPNSVTSIGNNAFFYCRGLTSVTIPNSVTSIGSEAFRYCSGLTKVNYLGTVDKWVEIDFDNYDSNPTTYAKDLYINNELITDVKITSADCINDYAFYNCESIKSLEIGENVKKIGYYAFNGCEKLKDVTAYSTTIPTAYTSSFTNYNAYLYIPCKVLEDYALHATWGSFKYIKCLSEDDAEEDTSVDEILSNSNITISEGTIACSDAEFTIYNTIGQNVTAKNGSLTPGVYVVKVADDIVKVMVK